MNNKNFKYFLLAAAIIVWGLVIRTVVKGLASDDKPNSKAPINLSAIDYSIKTDSFLLFNTYTDPFIPEIDTLQQKIDFINTQLKNVTTGTETFQPINTPTVVAKPDISFIKYNGMVANSSLKNKKAGFVTINGKDYMIKEGQKLEDIIIKKINKASLVINYKKQQFILQNNMQ